MVVCLLVLFCCFCLFGCELGLCFVLFDLIVCAGVCMFALVGRRCCSGRLRVSVRACFVFRCVCVLFVCVLVFAFVLRVRSV